MDTAPKPSFTPRTQKVLHEAHKISQGFGHSYVGTEHLLMALLAHPDGIAAEALTTAGVNRAALGQFVDTYIRARFTAPGPHLNAPVVAKMLRDLAAALEKPAEPPAAPTPPPPAAPSA